MNQNLLDDLSIFARRFAPKLCILDAKFQKQSSFIKHPARRKALFCTRRAAKSYTAGLYLFQTCIDFDNCNVLYIGLTRQSAKDIIWKDVLKVIDRKHKLGAVFNETEATATLPNGSVLKITGVDATEEEMHKLLGKKWKLVVVDEGQSYSVDLRILLDGILGPSIIDDDGTLCIMGTAGNLTQGLFYDITNNLEPGWTLFQWSAHDNPYVAARWQKELDDIDQNRPLFKLTALFKQWFLNLWVIDDNAKVYKFDAAINWVKELPQGINDWHYVLGLDLAHSPDSSSFVVGAYHETDPNLYFVSAEKHLGMDITAVANKVKELDAKYHFDVKVVDGANKQAVAELNNRHSLNLINADKTGKADFIKLMNDEFIQGKIKLLPGTDALYSPRSLTDPNQPKGEYQTLVWECDANGKVIEPRKEHPTLHNDACDSALYLWRYCYSYLFKAPLPFVDKSKQEHWEPLHIQKLADQVRKEQNPNALELEWNADWDDQWEEENAI
jgi:hypothetical protein